MVEAVESARWMAPKIKKIIYSRNQFAKNCKRITRKPFLNYIMLLFIIITIGNQIRISWETPIIGSRRVTIWVYDVDTLSHIKNDLPNESEGMPLRLHPG